MGSKHQISLFADDKALFTRLLLEGRKNIGLTIVLFGRASGLQVNLAKSEIIPIKCDNMDVMTILHRFLIAMEAFRYQVLGIVAVTQGPKEGGSHAIC